MPTQVYAVVHDGRHNFLIATRSERGYFFHRDAGGGIVVPAGRELDGGGPALPGGALGGRMHACDGAKKAFLEATGVDLDEYRPRLFPPAFHGVHDADVDYHGVFFQVWEESFQAILRLSGRNLEAAAAAANDAADGVYDAHEYAVMRRAYPDCPADNELDAVHAWSLDERWDEISGWEGAGTAGRFYQILAHFRACNPDAWRVQFAGIASSASASPTVWTEPVTRTVPYGASVVAR